MSSPWEVRFSNSKQLPYFYNPQTSASSWTPPAEFSSEAQIMALPGAQQYLAPHYQQQQHQSSQQRQQGSSGGREGQVRASHLLIKHSGSRRPASWKSQNITTSKSDAIKQLEAHLSYLNSVPAQDVARAFAELANKESDCSSHSKGGDLGWFGRGQMQRPFEEATFNLKPGQLSGIVDTDSGVHVILRTG